MDINDLTIVLANYNQSLGAGIKAVPEPSVLALVGVGAIALLLAFLAAKASLIPLNQPESTSHPSRVAHFMGRLCPPSTVRLVWAFALQDINVRGLYEPALILVFVAKFFRSSEMVAHRPHLLANERMYSNRAWFSRSRSMSWR